MITSVRHWISDAFNSHVLEKKRHVWVDYLRGIVIILVVYHHAFLGMVKNGVSVPQSIMDANMAAYSFRMPLFFIFSGIFTALALNSKSLKSIARDKFNLLFYPYVIWSIIQITLQIIFFWLHSFWRYLQGLFVYIISAKTPGTFLVFACPF